MKLIDKDALVAEIERIKKEECPTDSYEGRCKLLWFEQFLSFLNTLEVIDPYAQCIQYDSIEAGIEAHAEDYSFNIESELFQQLTKEQQVLWRKEIEQAVISGGYNGLDLARDPRYEENHEVKEVDLDESARHYLLYEHVSPLNKVLHQADLKVEMQYHKDIEGAYKAGFELGIKAQHDNWKVVDNINPPQADRNKIYCVFTKQRYILAKVIDHPQDDGLLQWKCTEFPNHRYDMCEGDKYMQIV